MVVIQDRVAVGQIVHEQRDPDPGSRIPILPPERLDAARPDYVMILPWNLKMEIMAQMAHVRDWGGRFIVPVPEVKVV